VVFVDEDGNPIEAGHENLVYVDEAGNEIPEDIAVQLLETGKYIDSREFYLGEQRALAQQSSGTFAGAQHHTASASLPASAFGSLSKSTGQPASQQQLLASDLLVRKASSQVISSSYQPQQQQQQQQQYATATTDNSVVSQTHTQQSLANSEARRLQRQSELDRMEQLDQASRLDASALLLRQEDSSVSNAAVSRSAYSKSVSNAEMQKSQSARRLIQPPPKRSETRVSNDSFIVHRQDSSHVVERQYLEQQHYQMSQPLSQTFSLNQLVSLDS
jgi:hypothetical protein